jgi:hypothetical protein
VRVRTWNGKVLCVVLVVRSCWDCLDFSPPSEVWLSGFSEQLIPQEHTYRHSATNKSPLTMAAPPDSLQFTDEDLSIAKGAIFVWAWWCVSVCVCAHVRLALLV